MPGRDVAVTRGDDLVKAVTSLGRELGLEIAVQFRVGRRLWGAIRRIDVILVHPQTRKTLGLECKCQSVTGTAEEKIPSTIQDIAAWPIPGIVVFAGDGFSDNMKNYLVASGRAVELEDLRPWLCLFFGLPIERPAILGVTGRLTGDRQPPRRSSKAEVAARKEKTSGNGEDAA
jgi:hypothetical protein